MTQLLDIQPKELKFIFEVKKQSSCSVRLTNNTYHNIAFKVKTTSPKKYCVRPNVGIINPKSTCEFIVTMQAQKVAPPDMVCKDKFLIQSTVVPVGTTENDITPSVFAKDDVKYIEEVKMRVAFVSPPDSPVLSPINGVLKPGPFFEPSVLEDPVLSKVEIPTPPQTVSKSAESRMSNGQEFTTANDVKLDPEKDAIDGQESKLLKDADCIPNIDIVSEEFKMEQDKELKQEKDAINDEYSKPAEDTEFPSVKNKKVTVVKVEEEPKLASDIEEMKSKLHVLETKINEAESTVSKLTEERRQSVQDSKILQEELDVLRRSTSVKRIYVGFPLLFVVMVALISVVVGYRLHP